MIETIRDLNDKSPKYITTKELHSKTSVLSTIVERYKLQIERLDQLYQASDDSTYLHERNAKVKRYASIIRRLGGTLISLTECSFRLTDNDKVAVFDGVTKKVWYVE